MTQTHLLQVLDQGHELRGVAMSTLCAMVIQLGKRYKIFIPTVKKVIGRYWSSSVKLT